jgi:hypothetical protein
MAEGTGVTEVDENLRGLVDLIVMGEGSRVAERLAVSPGLAGMQEILRAFERYFESAFDPS